MKHSTLFTLCIMSFMPLMGIKPETKAAEILVILGNQANAPSGIQEGTLILNNHTDFPIGYQFETTPGTGNIKGAQFIGTGKKLIAKKLGADPYFILEPGKRVELNTPIRIDAKLGGAGSIWGPIISLTLLNKQTNKAKIFQLAKAIEYSIVNNEQDEFKLLDNNGNIIE